MIYWDHNATTPCAPEVVDAMQPFWGDEYGNASSSHLMGRRAAAAVKKAKEQVAALMNAVPSEIVFTSGATESNNLLFLGVLLTPRTERKRIVISAIEHKSVLDPAALLEEHGFEVVRLPASPAGVTELEVAKEMITDRTLLVSVQAANNELGTLQPISELAELSHDRGAFFHTDAAQVLGKVPFDLQQVNCDFASFSAHKMYGPKGIGAIFVRGGVRRWPWTQPFRGGGQQNGLRPGTLNVPSIVGFGRACNLALCEMRGNASYLKKLSLVFIQKLADLFPDAKIVNDISHSLPGTLSVLLPGIASDFLIARCPKVQISKGSACNGAIGSSHVLNEVIRNHDLRESVIRISFGRHTKEEDFEVFFDILNSLKSGGQENAE